jgi:hypothetical protein
LDSVSAKEAGIMAEYIQIKVAIKPAIAEPYKAACRKSGVKIAADLAAYMAGRAGKLERLAHRRAVCSRGMRRARLSRVIGELESIMDEEAAYRDSIPENLQNGRHCESAGETIQALDEALDRLREAFQ